MVEGISSDRRPVPRYKHEVVVETNFNVMANNRQLKVQMAQMLSSFRRIQKETLKKTPNWHMIGVECEKHLPKKLNM